MQLPRRALLGAALAASAPNPPEAFAARIRRDYDSVVALVRAGPIQAR